MVLNSQDSRNKTYQNIGEAYLIIYCLFLLAIILSVLPLAASGYTFGIFKYFLSQISVKIIFMTSENSKCSSLVEGDKI